MAKRRIPSSLLEFLEIGPNQWPPFAPTRSSRNSAGTMVAIRGHSLMHRSLPTLLRVGLILVPASFLAGFLLPSEARSRQPPDRKELLGEWEGRARPGSLTGPQVCSACHADIAAEQEAHPMARTGLALLAGTADPWFSDERLDAAVLWRSPGPDADERPRYLRTRGGPWPSWTRRGRAPRSMPSSARACGASPPFTFTAEGGMRELRITWSRGMDAWIETPGSEGDRHPLGDLDSPRAMRDCVGCHATAAAWNGPAPDLAGSDWGVRCERCHGPGEAHAGTTDARLIFNPGRLPPAEEVRFCGQCHRDADGLRTAAGAPAGPRSHPPRRRQPDDERLFPRALPGAHHFLYRVSRPASGRGFRRRTESNRLPRMSRGPGGTSRLRARDCRIRLSCLPHAAPGRGLRGSRLHRSPDPGSGHAPGLRLPEERADLEYLELLYRNELSGENDQQEEARLLVGLGELLFAQGLQATAVETLERGLAAGPDYQRLLKAAALLRASGQPESAEAALIRATSLEPEATQAFFDLGDLRLQRGDSSGALEPLEEARRLDSVSPVVASRLGAAYRGAERPEDALREGLAAVELESSWPGPWLELGLTRWQRRELKAADEAAPLRPPVGFGRAGDPRRPGAAARARSGPGGPRRHGSEAAGGAARRLRGVPGAALARSARGRSTPRTGISSWR